MRRVRLIIIATVLAVAGCATLEDSSGYMPPAEDVAEVTVGLDTKDTVRVLLGPPGTTGVLQQDAWYYVASDYERFLWRAPVEVNREVLVVSYADNGVVQNLERFGLEDGRVVVLSRRVTSSSVAEISILRQIFSNIGNLAPDQFIGDN